MSNLLKNLLIALGLAIILFIGYITFVRDDGSDAMISESLSPEVRQETQQLLSTLQELKSINVEGRIFSDPLFLSLRDFRVELGTEPEGRSNPFAPLQ
jgi:hypothetical protein